MRTYKKYILNVLTALLVLTATSAIAEEVSKSTTTPTLTVDVNGLVCDFCAQAVTKVFKKQVEVMDVDVNLTDKKISVWLKDGQDIPDDKITKLVVDSGYNVVKINRGEGS